MLKTMVFIIGFVLLIRGIFGDELLHIDNVMLTSGGTVFNDSGVMWDPHRVIDGNNRTDANSCHCCTAISRPSWIALNIGQPYLLTKIEIYGRTDEATDQSQNLCLYVRLLEEIDEPCLSITYYNHAIVFNPPRLGQFVNITGLNTGAWTGKVMTICEINIFHQNAINIAKINGLNITQVNTYNTCDANKAVDGMYLSSYTNDAELCSKCSATNSGKPHWQIDFGTPVIAHFINIIGRVDDASHQSENLLVYTSNISMTQNNDSLVAYIISTNKDLSQVFEIGTQSFRYLTIQRFYSSVMTLCEVNIYQKECMNGTYGTQCQKCGHCKAGTACNKTTGVCQSGCEQGWTTSKCDNECEDGTYGFDCQTKCGYCKTGSTCNKTTGICQSGCEAGWQHNTCDTDCDKGKYGINCSHSCSEHCFVPYSCNKKDGTCYGGCTPGYDFQHGPTCDFQCSNGTYGLNCSHVCSQYCSTTHSCHKNDGKCIEGCSPGYDFNADPKCSSACSPGKYGSNCASECNCKQCQNINGSCAISNSCDTGFSLRLTDARCTECSRGLYGDNCSMECHCEECHNVNGSCALFSKPCHNGFHFENGLCKADEADKIERTSAAAVGGGVGAAVSVIVAAAVVVIVMRRRHMFKKQAKQHDGTEMTDIFKKARSSTGQDNDAFSDAVNQVYENPENPYYSFKDAVPGIKVHLLWDFIREKTKSGSSYFADEFSKLPTGLIHKHDVASLPENRGKNRYREMFAYDHSRVPLTKDKQTDSEYINACFIHGFGKVNKFIASQGPTEKMIDDFWRMVWQQRVEKIAMLTNLIELGTLKCLQYWPEEIGSSTTFGDVNVTYIGTEDTYDYNIRTLNIKKSQETRRVKQFHFKTWNDKDVPDTTWCLLDFWKAVDTNDSTNTTPIVVHCSAGVGRTGTFIALDNLIIQGRLEGSVRPFPMVEALRQQRVSMVQTKDQYVYLHEALAEALLMGTHHVLTRQFESVYTYMMGKEKGSYIARVDEQFDLIVRSAEESALKVDEQAHASSEPMYGNIDIVMSEIDAYRPQLLKRGSKVNQQLGAMFIPAFNTTNALLVCMSPTDQHLEEFWSLVDEHHVTTVINLSAPGCAAYESCQYLGGRGSGRVGKFSVNYIHEKRNNSTVERSFSFRDENHEDEDYLTTIKQFQLTSWLDGHDTPPDMQSFLHLIEEILKWQPHLSDKRPILIHCQTGFIRCGLAAVVLNEIQRIRKENGQINIVESVKTMKNRFRDFVHSKEQYRFCYEAILSYVQNSGNYQSL